MTSIASSSSLQLKVQNATCGLLLKPCGMIVLPQVLHDAETAAHLAAWLGAVMVWLNSQDRPIAFAATCKDAAALPACLRAAGCLDCEVKLPAPGASGRASMLAAGVHHKSLTMTPEDIQVIACVHAYVMPDHQCLPGADTDADITSLPRPFAVCTPCFIHLYWSVDCTASCGMGCLQTSLCFMCRQCMCRA